jgi:hypothetical protein
MNVDDQEPDSSHLSGAETPSLPSLGSDSFRSTGHEPGCARSRGELHDGNSRRQFRWSKAARELVRENKMASGAELSALVTRLVEESGNPRRACWRFVRRMGIRSKRRVRKWSESEEQRLIKLIDLHPVNEIGRLMGRSHSSVWHRLYRLGATASMGKDGFTKYTLASALHVAVTQIEAWIHRGWLKAREVQTGHVKRVTIASADLCDFCKEHTSDVAGNRLTKERLDFVYLCAFLPSHAELLPVRESKKERIAYEAQLEEDRTAAFGPEHVDEGGDAIRRTA